MGFLQRLRPSTDSPSSAQPNSPHLIVPSVSFDPASLKANMRVLSPDQVACIAYFPASDTDLPRLGMNMDVRFIRPGHLGTAMDFPLHPSRSDQPSRPRGHAHTESLPAAFPSSSHLVLPSLCELHQPDSRARNALRKLRVHTQRLGVSSKPWPTQVLDPEQLFQDEQHDAHVCWRCRKAGGRQKNCRAFRRPGDSLAAEMYA